MRTYPIWVRSLGVCSVTEPVVRRIVCSVKKIGSRNNWPGDAHGTPFNPEVGTVFDLAIYMFEESCNILPDERRLYTCFCGRHNPNTSTFTDIWWACFWMD